MQRRIAQPNSHLSVTLLLQSHEISNRRPLQALKLPQIIFSDKLSRSRFVTQLRHESRNVARCESPTTRLSRLRQGHPDAGFDRNGCLASAGQWRGSHLDLAIAQRVAPGRAD